MPVATGTAIAAGAAVLGAGAQAYSSGKTNLKTRRLIRQQYEKQKADNLENWNRLNDYNHPQQQMERLKSAGLNPQLIYGSSSSQAAGNASGAATTPTHGKYTPQPLGLDRIAPSAISTIQAMADLEHKEAVTSNVRAQGINLLEDRLIKQAQREDTVESYRNKRLDRWEKEGMRGVSAEYQKELLRQKKNEIDYAAADEERKIIRMSQDTEEYVQTLANHKLRNKQLKQNMSINEIVKGLKKVELELANSGIYKGDKVYERIIALELARYGISLNQK